MRVAKHLVNPIWIPVSIAVIGYGALLLPDPAQRGARIIPTEVTVRGSDLANQNWDPAQDKPFLKLRAEQDALWKKYRTGDTKRELLPMYRKALATWQKDKSLRSLYRAYSLAFLGRYLTHNNRVGGELVNEWQAFAKLRSLEAARVVYLYLEFTLVDDEYITKIALDSLKRRPSDEPVQLHICNDSYFEKSIQARAMPIALAHLDDVYNDPQWAAAVAITFVSSMPKPHEVHYQHALIAYQAMACFERMVPKGQVSVGTKKGQLAWSKSFPKDRPFASNPWKFGPLKGKPFSVKG